MILAIKTDSPIAELYVLDDTGDVVAEKIWLAERRLAKELLGVVEDLLADSGGFAALKGVILFAGPGSFTGLRIGITVGNAIAYAESVPVVGEIDKTWMTDGVMRLKNEADDRVVLPQYGGDAHITTPRK